ncbi:inorganic diphosphatase [Streptomyces sp. NPDC056835]|uniref:inorganic diphosphatase n=1 Tax=Streptomyces sp. NPDC056835 TaxID=3345956 RepID=UPI0036B5BE84
MSRNILRTAALIAVPVATIAALGVTTASSATPSSSAASATAAPKSPAAAPAAAAAEGCWPSTPGGYVHPLAFPQPAAKDIPKQGYNVVVEIPQDSITKYEIDPSTGQFVVSRFMSMPVTYPANYGSVPQSVGGDGDPLDGLVLTREPLTPGAVINVRAIGVLHMVDDGDEDEKVISVPVDDVDPTYSEIKTIKDLPSMEQQRIEAFFRVYKDLGSDKKVELNGYGNATEATKLVQSNIATYQKKCAS